MCFSFLPTVGLRRRATEETGRTTRAAREDPKTEGGSEARKRTETTRRTQPETGRWVAAHSGGDKCMTMQLLSHQATLGRVVVKFEMTE